MTSLAESKALAQEARRLYTRQVIAGLHAAVTPIAEFASELVDRPAERGVQQRRRETHEQFRLSGERWQQGAVAAIERLLVEGAPSSRLGDLRDMVGSDMLSLVDDAAIEREILCSKLALAGLDRSAWEFSDLRARISSLDDVEELDTHDLLRPHVLARAVIDAWFDVGLTLAGWVDLQRVLHEEFATLNEVALHEVNCMLVERGVMPEIDLRPLIRRARATPTGGATEMAQLDSVSPGEPGGYAGGGAAAAQRSAAAPSRFIDTEVSSGPQPMTGVGAARALLMRLNRMVVDANDETEFAKTVVDTPRALSPAMARAIDTAQHSISQHFDPSAADAPAPNTSKLLGELETRKRALKDAAETPVERATIEIVALLFQAILSEERIPTAVRVWFARLQMPVLRVAVTEPDFFATTDHPARRLIDRMGACVMGFDGAAVPGDTALEQEIRRIVQVVEAYPDTGRRVFQTVLIELEKFLEHFFSSENEVTRKGVSLAQQLEQREILAIQYTIELRKMLADLQVQEGVREFLFHVWADVLALAAVRHGIASQAAKDMKAVATDLIWSAGAKVSREQRAEVIRRLPSLLKALREGMGQTGVPLTAQDAHIAGLNNSLAAAFTAKAAVIDSARFEELKDRLGSLEELLPDAGDVNVDESVVLDLSGYESSELEVVGEGGASPSDASLAWARELQVGTWFRLNWREREEPLQLAWRGLHKQLALFITPGGRCVLFQHTRLAAFLEACLLVPAQDESLTVRATRTALAKIDADPTRLQS